MDEQKHSYIGASSAHRWMNCPGSVALCKKMPPQESSKYAEEGTGAHELAAKCLVEGRDANDFVCEIMSNDIEVTEEMAEHVNSFLEYVENIRKTGKFILLTEAKFDLSKAIYPGLYGTGDVILASSDLKELHVIDFKYGAGVVVEVEENAQLMYYALGAINYAHEVKKWVDSPSVFGWDLFEKVVVHIFQPRARHKDGGARSWEIPKGRLDKFADELKASAIETEKKEAKLVAGDHCKFCAGMPGCSAFANRVSDLAVSDFRVIPATKKPELPQADSLSLEQVVKILNWSDLISDWLKSVNEYAQLIAERGDKVPGYKLVKKKTNRRWKDEVSAADELSLVLPDDKIWTKKIISPAQAEKALGKKNAKLLEPMVEKPEGGNTLAPESDPRPEITGSIENDFSVLN